MRAFLVPLLLASAGLLAGCTGLTEDGVNAPETPVDDLLRPADEPLWYNPQTTPHPAFNYPTLTHYAVGSNVSQWLAPIAAATLPDPIKGFDLLAADGDAAARGAGMSVFGSLAVLPGTDKGSIVFDISDPAQPKVLSNISGNHRNVDFILYPTGRLVAIFATGGGTLPYWDITDPTSPVQLGELEPTTGTHKVNVVPGTPIVYNANSNGGGDFFVQCRQPECGTGVTEIFDLSVPESPVLVQDWKNGFGCHHIYFWNNPSEDKYRGLCAGIEMTQIWDTKDPRHPEVLVNVPMQHGNPGLPSTSLSIESFSHFSILNYAGDVLIVGDESGGGGVPPGCAARAGTPVRDVSTPVGALWFYDVSDEKNPVLKGWFSPGTSLVSNPPAPGSGVGAAFYSCTAHHGRLVPDPAGRELLAMSFYRAGVVLVDFTDPAGPKMLDQYNAGTNVWETQYYNGYLFTGDLARGMDVLKFT